MGNFKPISYYPLLYAVLKLQFKVQVSIERSAVSGQRSAVSGQLKAHPGRTALWNRVLTCDLTQIKQMVTCCQPCKARVGETPCSEAASLIQKYRSSSTICSPLAVRVACA
ncbi:hypothetical protein [Moorena sp. SIO4G3]|uniref:hypothetical protein n=1 Tax=Moorena sp. SIO4G3 TaxID=2607821 RepID=UPI0014295021|nr:hypothetical protein [Moorena sp. SIO4G3]NEO79144.1 hypothetical protein [Moorena sp. SIO4G3]